MVNGDENVFILYTACSESCLPFFYSLYPSKFVRELCSTLEYEQKALVRPFLLLLLLLLLLLYACYSSL